MFKSLTIGSILMVSISASAGEIVCQASQQGEPAITITLDYEEDGTTLKSSAPIGFNSQLFDYDVVYSRFNEAGRNLLIAHNPASPFSQVIELTGAVGPNNFSNFDKMVIGNTNPIGQFVKNVVYDLVCN